MPLFARPPLYESVLADPALGLAERAAALIELGRWLEAEATLDAAPAESQPVLAARALAGRGELLRALTTLDGLAGDAPGVRRERARALGTLGRLDEALSLLDGDPDNESRLLRVELHLEAGEAAPAEVELAGEDAAPPGGRPAGASATRDAARLALARGEAREQLGREAEALPHLVRARRLAQAAGSAGVLARAWSRLGEAHAGLGNRWRALRSVTHALDLAATGRVAAWLLPGVHYRAFVVYGMYGHGARAESALQSGHHLVIQLASGIDVRELRETFLIDNRDCQRLIGAWKGETSWGYEVPRGS